MELTSGKHIVEIASSAMVRVQSIWCPVLRIPSAKEQWCLTKAATQPQALYPAWYIISFYKIPFLLKPASMDYVAIKNIK